MSSTDWQPPTVMTRSEAEDALSALFGYHYNPDQISAVTIEPARVTVKWSDRHGRNHTTEIPLKGTTP